MTPVFIDSSFFKAVIDPKDDFYELGKTIWKQLLTDNVSLVTTNYILDETFTLIRCKCDLKKALELRNVLARKDLNLAIIRVTIDDDAASWEWFERDWSKLSFTDCVSFAVMKRLGLEEVATFDNHFKQAGFKIVKA